MDLENNATEPATPTDPNASTEPSSGTPTEPATPAAGNEPAHEPAKNVSMKDFNALSDKIDKILAAQSEPAPTPEPKPAKSGETKVDPQAEQLAQLLHDKAVTDTQTALKDAGYEVGGIAELFLGSDGKVSDSNIKAFTDFMTAHDEALKKQFTPSTDAGFDAKNTNIGGTSAEEFIKSMVSH